MIYIPEEFLIDKKNMSKVAKILNALNIDVYTTSEETAMRQAKNELSKLGETKIIEKIEDGFFTFGA